LLDHLTALEIEHRRLERVLVDVDRRINITDLLSLIQRPDRPFTAQDRAL